MKTATGLRPANLVRSVVALAAIAAMAVTAVVLWGTLRPASASPLGGIIYYTTQFSEYTVHPDGSPAVLSGPPPVEFVRQGGVEEFPAPLDNATAYIERKDGNAYLSVRDASGSRRIAQLADPSSPPLVDGVKPDARSLGGIPLVVEWSPDASYLAFGGITGAPYTLHVVKTATWEEQSFIVDGGYVGELRWSHGGDRLAISTYSLDRVDHSAYVLDPEGGVPVRVIDGCHIIWSPDGTHIVLHRDPQRAPGVWIVAIDGSEAFALSNDETGFPYAWIEEDAAVSPGGPSAPDALSSP